MRIDCEHGQLARSCDICFLQKELAEITAERDRYRDLLEQLADMTPWYHSDTRGCRFCYAPLTNGAEILAKHESTCLWLAARDALKGTP